MAVAWGLSYPFPDQSEYEAPIQIENIEIKSNAFWSLEESFISKEMV